MNVYEEVEAFYEDYRGPKTVIGKSEGGRNLYAMFAGSEPSPLGISQYAIHGREWIVALLALEHLRQGVPRGGVWILPLMNPDGALLSEVGLASLPAEKRGEPLFRTRLPLFKANLNGVDLNVNFDARWGTGEHNLRTPAPSDYIGEAPFCAAETRALRDFTLNVRPDYTVSWHTKGEVLYWEFFQPPLRRRRDKKIAEKLSEATGYPLASAGKSAGGYKDWCIEALKIPAFTVEAGRENLSHPILRGEFPALARRLGGALGSFCGSIAGG